MHDSATDANQSGLRQ